MRAANLPSRRQAVLTFGALWGALTMPTSALAQALPAWAPKALTSDQARALETAAELIMPATDTPGAREAGVPQFVDRAVALYCDPAEAALIRSGLDRMNADARAAHGGPFAALKTAQQTAMLAAYDAEAARRAQGAPHFFATLKEMVTVGYFTSEPGAMKALRYDPIPGEYRGCVPLSEIGRAWAT